MNLNEKILILRGALAGAMKNHAQYQEIICNPKPQYWKKILKGEKIDLGCNSIYGDVFAFWYSELRIGQDELTYDLVWNEFSSIPRPKEILVREIK